MSREALLAEYESLKNEYEKIKASGLKLDISRGKPCTEQLNLSDGLLTILQGKEDCLTEGGFDCPNRRGYTDGRIPPCLCVEHNLLRW